MSGLGNTETVAVIGAGAMGAGIAQVAASAGHPVVLYDARGGAAEAGRAGILNSLDRLVAKGRLSAADRDAVTNRLSVAASLEDLKDARLVVEAIVENLDVKRKLFAALEEIVDERAILATNTSSLSVTAIAAGLTRAERVAGLHFFNPAPVMKLVEIVAGLASEESVLQLLHDTALAWGKTPVRATSTPGFIVNRVARPFYAEALRLMEEGFSDAPTIDAILREQGGFRMGPFELMDLIGHDVNFAVTRSVFDAYFGDPRYRPSLSQQELVAAGWLGRKSGRGFYDHAPGAGRPEPANAPPAPAPPRLTVEGNLGPAESLVSALEENGVQVDRRSGVGQIRVGGARLAQSDGRSATARVAEGEAADLILFDLALDYTAAKRIAIAKADQTPAAALADAAGLFQHLGKQVSVVDDAPGLIVLRTLAMLVNEASEAALNRVATPQDIDLAMTLGVNYPRGPLGWANAVGPSHLLSALNAIHAATGDPRYRASQYLRRRVASGNSFPVDPDAPSG
jgi:3-hydroxybutyryl-CoA dehydrogenase